MRRRLLSLFLGTLFTLVLLELLLSASAGVFAHLQARADRIREGEESADEVRILCVGESTTAVAGDPSGHILVTSTAWPVQLEAELNAGSAAHGGPRFHVYNFGAMGGTTNAVLERLTAEVLRLRPDFVITMMGLKDSPADDASGTDLGLLDHLHTVKLLKWSAEAVHLRQTAAPKEVHTAADIPPALRATPGELQAFVRETLMLPAYADAGIVAKSETLELAVYEWKSGRYPEAEARLVALIDAHGIGYNLLAQVQEMDAHGEDAITTLRAGIAAHPEEASYQQSLAELLERAGRTEEARTVLAAALHPPTPFREPDLVNTYLRLTEAAFERDRGDPTAALMMLGDTPPVSLPPEQAQWFPSPLVIWHLRSGEALSDLSRWGEAEAHLKAALALRSSQGAVMWTLAEVYRKSGQIAQEEQLRRQMVDVNARVADYYELAQVLRRTGQDGAATEVLRGAVQRIPALPANYRRLYSLAESGGFQLIVMQYPAFPLGLLQTYAPPERGVRFVDNEHLFEADPDRYFFEPQFPFSFSHYTHDGAALVAHQAAVAVRAARGDP